jgi:hypothetical protein
MIHQCYFASSQQPALFDPASGVYRPFGLEPEVNPQITRNCTELEDPKVRIALVEYGAMLHHWRNPHEDTDPWIGFTSYRHRDKSPVVFTAPQQVEQALASADILGWCGHRFQDTQTGRPVTLAEQAERSHPGIVSFLYRLLLMRNERMPDAFLVANAGLFANFWAASRASFNAFMEWSFPLVRWCLANSQQPYLQSHPKAIGYVIERLFILWYLMKGLRVTHAGPIIEMRNPNPFATASLERSAGEEQLITLSMWHATLAELCERHRVKESDVLVLDEAASAAIAAQSREALGCHAALLMKVTAVASGGGVAVGEADAFLKPIGFTRRETLLTQAGVGDAIYIREGAVPAPPADMPKRLEIARAETELQRIFNYDVIGYGARTMEILYFGQIGQGASQHEKNWLMRTAGHDVLLEFVGIHGRTAVLRLDADGSWRGRLCFGPKYPIELTPLREPKPAPPQFAEAEEQFEGFPNGTNVPVRLAERLRDHLGIRDFVETGTYRGGTVRIMSPRFERIHTVELQPAIYEATRERLSNLTNVDFRLGDTEAHLPDILSRLKGPALIWLDAHWSAGETGKTDTQCPLLRELAIVYGSRGDHVVMIDDARLFMAPAPPPMKPEDWPSIAQIEAFLAQQQSAPFVKVVGDVIVAVPTAAREVVEEYLRRKSASKLEI